MGFKNLVGALVNGGTGSSDMDLVRSIASNPRINEILAPYGLGMPEQIDDDVIPAAPDSYFGRHPAIHNAVQNALLGAASVAPSRTPGEAIANIARGVLSVPQLRSQAAMSKLMAPFQMAGIMADLDEKSAHAQYWREGGRSMRTAQDTWVKVGPTPDRKNFVVYNNHSGEFKSVPIPGGLQLDEKDENLKIMDIAAGAAGELPEQKDLRGKDLEASINKYRRIGAQYGAFMGTVAGNQAGARNRADQANGGLTDVQQQVLRQYDTDFKTVDDEYNQYFKLQKPSEIDANFSGATYNDKKAARVKKLDELRQKKNEIDAKKKAYANSIGIRIGGPSAPAPSAPVDPSNPFRHN